MDEDHRQRAQAAYQASFTHAAKNAKRAAYNKFIPKRTDDNQPDIVKAFKDFGFKVTSLHASGYGVYDLLVAKSFLVASVEVKNPLKPPSARKLTLPQIKWASHWPGLKFVALNTDDVISICNEMGRILAAIHNAGVIPKKAGNQEAQYRV